MVKIRFFEPLASLMKTKTLSYEAETVGELFGKLVKEYPVMQDKLYDEKGEFKKFLKIYIGKEDINLVEGLETKLEEDSEIKILYAIAGG